TPVIALVVSAAVVIIMAISTSKVGVLAGGTTTFLLIVFALLHAGLVRAKMKNMGEKPLFRIPVFIPMLGSLLSVLLLLSRDLSTYKVGAYLAAGAVVLFIINWFILGRKTVEA